MMPDFHDNPYALFQLALMLRLRRMASEFGWMPVRWLFVNDTLVERSLYDFENAMLVMLATPVL